MSYTAQQQIYATLTRQVAARYGINPDVAEAQIYQESRFNPTATSGAGARGIAQFIPATAARFGLSNVFDPAASLEAWGKYMSLMLKMFNGRMDIALAGYNSGENRAEYRNAAAQGRAINWSVLPAGVQGETQSYVNTILSRAGAGGSRVTTPQPQTRTGGSGDTTIYASVDVVDSAPTSDDFKLDSGVLIAAAIVMGSYLLME